VSGPQAASSSWTLAKVLGSTIAGWAVCSDQIQVSCGSSASGSGGRRRTVGVYAFIMILFRLSGERGLANLNAFDFVVIFLLSNVVQNAIIGSDDSLTGAAIGAVALVAVKAALNRWLASRVPAP
jgi:hypothetical protein